MFLQDLNTTEALSCWLLVVVCTFLFGLTANLLALPSAKCHLNTFSISPLLEIPKYPGYLPKIYSTTWSPMSTHYVLQTSPASILGISHIEVLCSTTGVESSTTVYSLHFGCFSFFLPPLLTPRLYYGLYP